MELLFDYERYEIKRFFRQNLEIDQKTELINELEKHNLIVIEKKTFIRCVNPKDPDYLELSQDQKDCTERIYIEENQEFVVCNRCNRGIFIEDKSKYHSYQLKINYSGIVEILKSRFEKEGIIYEMNNFHFIIKENGKHEICLVDLCKELKCKTKFYYSDDILFLFCDITKKIDSNNFIWILDLLKKRNLRNYIINNTPSEISEELNQLMHKKVDNITWQKFESLITEFHNSIGKNQEKYNEVLIFFKKYSGTILSSFTFHIGGSGNPDAYTVSLIEYIKPFFETEITIECKYSEFDSLDSSITRENFRQLRDQCTEGKGIIISNRKKISSYAISRCIDFKRSRNHWIYVIIHRPLLKLLISLFQEEFERCIN